MKDQRVIRYMSLSLLGRLYFWQAIVSRATIAARLSSVDDFSMIGNANRLRELVQLAHVISGYCMAIINGNADESDISGLIKSVDDCRLEDADVVSEVLANINL